jgi:hypothetical protein
MALATAFPFAVSAPAAGAIPREITYNFGERRPTSSVQSGLFHLSFSAVTVAGKPIELAPETFEIVDGPTVDSAFTFEAELRCRFEGQPITGFAHYYVAIGKGGRRGLPIHQGHFVYRGAARLFGGRKQGQIEVRGHVSASGKAATGTVLVRKTRTGGFIPGAIYADCHSGNGRRATPLRWRLIGERLASAVAVAPDLLGEVPDVPL